MKHVFYLDMYPNAHLVTLADPEPRRWNGWEIPNPTPREVLYFLGELRAEMEDDDFWDTLSAFMSAYGNDRHDDTVEHHGIDDPILGYMGFTWQKRQMFDPNMSPLNRAEAAGHRARTGHELNAYLVPVDDDELGSVVMKRVRLCCPEPINGMVIHLSKAEGDALLRNLESADKVIDPLVELLNRREK